MSSEDEEYTRIRFSDEFGKYVDDHLEIVFWEVYHEKISDPEAIALLLDPYAANVNGQNAVPFSGALTDTEHAIKWATQFQPVTIKQLNNDEAREIKKTENDPREIHFVAHLDGQRTRAYGRTVRQAAVLAAVHSLRELADQVLNAQPNERAN